MGPFFVNRIRLGKFIFGETIIFLFFFFLALASTNIGVEANSATNFSGPARDWTTRILAFMSEGKNELLLLYINVNMPSNFIDYFLYFGFAGSALFQEFD